MIERYYKEIRVEFERQKVHIYARKPLYDFLEQKSKKDALVLSEYILREYKKLYGRELKISRDSEKDRGERTRQRTGRNT